METENERGGRAAWENWGSNAPKGKQEKFKKQALFAQSLLKSRYPIKGEFTEVARTSDDDPFGLLDPSVGPLDRFYQCYDYRFHFDNRQEFREKADKAVVPLEEFLRIIDPRLQYEDYFGLHCRTCNENVRTLDHFANKEHHWKVSRCHMVQSGRCTMVQGYQCIVEIPLSPLTSVYGAVDKRCAYWSQHNHQFGLIVKKKLVRLDHLRQHWVANLKSTDAIKLANPIVVPPMDAKSFPALSKGKSKPADKGEVGAPAMPRPPSEPASKAQAESSPSAPAAAEPAAPTVEVSQPMSVDPPSAAAPSKGGRERVAIFANCTAEDSQEGDEEGC